MDYIIDPQLYIPLIEAIAAMQRREFYFILAGCKPTELEVQAVLEIIMFSRSHQEKRELLQEFASLIVARFHEKNDWFSVPNFLITKLLKGCFQPFMKPYLHTLLKPYFEQIANAEVALLPAPEQIASKILEMINATFKTKWLELYVLCACNYKLFIAK